MLILKYNAHLSVQELFEVEHIMLKIGDRKKPQCSDLLKWGVLEQSRPVIYGFLLGYASRLGVYETLGISPSEFFDFLVDVDHGYLPNHYHAFPHAADVALVIYHMLVEFEAGGMLTCIDLASLFIAGLCHDLGHPGKNNNFQVNRKTELAIRYENLSVLESYSCTLTIQLLEKHRLLRHLGWPSVDRVRTSIIKMILATDMVFHYELQENLASLLEIVDDQNQPQQPLSRPVSAVSDLFDGRKSPLHLFFDPARPCSPPLSATPDDGWRCRRQSSTSSSTMVVVNRTTTVFTPQERQMLCQILLHAADISNPSRAWQQCNAWSDRVCQEFFCQGELEKQLELPVSPNMDRDQISQTRIGLQFGDFIVSPFFEIFAALFPKASVLVDQLGLNRLEWLRLEEEQRTMGAPAGIEKNGLSASAHDNPPHPNQTAGAAAVAQAPATGRRVSVAAGMVLIPEERLLQRPGQGGARSVSDTSSDALSVLGHWRRKAQAMERRRSEEPSLVCHLPRKLEQPPSSSRRRMSSIRQGPCIIK